MQTFPFQTIILAGGDSKRFAGRSKVLQPLGGVPLLTYALNAAHFWGAQDVHVVLSPRLQGHNLLKELRPFRTVIQDSPRGTGHAVQTALVPLLPYHDTFLILMGDSALMDPSSLAPLMEAWRTSSRDLLLLSINPPQGHTYGRILPHTSGGGRVKAVVENHLCDPLSPQVAGALCYSGIMLIRAGAARQLLWDFEQDPPSDARSGEYYLTDWVAKAHDLGLNVAHVEGPWASLQGINTPEEWCAREHDLQVYLRGQALRRGVWLHAPDTVVLAYDTQLEPGVVIYPYVVIGPGVTLQAGACVHPFSHVEHCVVKAGAQVGPFARLRGNTHLEPDSLVGSFVELKETTLGRGSRVKHLSYLGNAVIEADVTVGAGVVTANYDGHQKFFTHIGEGSLVGCNSTLVAPLTLGKHVTLGAGSTVTQPVPDGHMSLSRMPQTNRPIPPSSRHLRRKRSTPL